MRALTRVSAAIVVAVVVAACGSGGSGGSDTSSAPPEPTYVAATLNCDQYAVRATNLVTFVHYASLNVGTSNDSASYFTEMQQAMADLKANAASCAPNGAAALDDMQATIDAAQDGYQASDSAGAVAANKVLLDALAAQGALTWKALGLSAQGWDNVLRYTA